jgi:hypothetical protein
MHKEKYRNKSKIIFIFFFKYDDLCTNIWKCFATDDDDEYDEDQHNIVAQIQQLRQQLDQSRNELERQGDTNSSSDEQLRISFGRFIDLLVSYLNKQYRIINKIIQ